MAEIRTNPNLGLVLTSDIDHRFFVGWVEHPDIYCWVSFLNPTYLSAIFVVSSKPNKMAEDRTITQNITGDL
jgi:hypothetical protein